MSTGNRLLGDGPKEFSWWDRRRAGLAPARRRCHLASDLLPLALGRNKVRLFCSFQRNEVEKCNDSEIRVLGNSVQAIQDLGLHKPVKIVFQSDARGSAQRWIEITVDEQTIEPSSPPPTVAEPQQKGSRQ